MIQSQCPKYQHTVWTVERRDFEAWWCLRSAGEQSSLVTSRHHFCRSTGEDDTSWNSASSCWWSENPIETTVIKSASWHDIQFCHLSDVAQNSNCLTWTHRPQYNSNFSTAVRHLVLCVFWGERGAKSLYNHIHICRLVYCLSSDDFVFVGFFCGITTKWKQEIMTGGSTEAILCYALIFKASYVLTFCFLFRALCSPWRFYTWLWVHFTSSDPD